MRHMKVVHVTSVRLGILSRHDWNIIQSHLGGQVRPPHGFKYPRIVVSVGGLGTGTDVPLVFGVITGVLF